MLKEFLIKRLFIIAPIFWCCLLAVLLLRYLQGFFITGDLYQPEWIEVFLNFSLLFGFVMLDKYFSVGTWSIRNEVVFYSIFPMVIYSYMRFGKSIAACWLFISILLGWYFTSFLIDANKELAESWHVYVNPLNQLF